MATFVDGQFGSFKITTTGFPAASFPTPTLPANLAGLSFTDNGDGTATISGIPTGAASTTPTSVKIVAMNSAGSVMQFMSLTVLQLPTLTLPASPTFTVGSRIPTFTITASGGVATAKTALTISPKLPSGLAFKDNGNGTASITGIPAANTGGAATFTVTATSAAGVQSQSFTLSINQRPAFTSAGAATFVVGQASSFTVTATGFPHPALSATVPAGLTFTDNHNGTATISGTPQALSAHIDSVIVTAHNGIGADATQTLVLTVNQAPLITSAGSDTFTVGQPNSFTIRTTGFPALTTITTSRPAQRRHPACPTRQKARRS